MNIYKECPTFENESYELRLFRNEDCHDYLKVYGDKNALPYFNSDNCDGDNFFYNTEEKMRNALEFWQMSYEKGWFVRMSIVDKKKSEVIGSVELCTRVSDDDFNNMGILRVDVRSDYENEKELYSIFSLITPHIEGLLGCKGVITKGALYAVERLAAISKAGFVKSEKLLYGKNGVVYDGYWVRND
ncbi:GNAT family N-acetyltransferase [Butyrivibrio sp. VCD2006]|uniref:GNAT family N-acetyltransferase n=1 Tax=Butyrivibrio sp. VCD2006 TaxID=1280664 RepID=UPI00042455AE|nr:hypothetical protein [Butyrivibrio sp. VCD2006]